MVKRIRFSHPTPYDGETREVGEVLDVEDSFAARAVTAGLARYTMDANTPPPPPLSAPVEARVKAIIKADTGWERQHREAAAAARVPEVLTTASELTTEQYSAPIGAAGDYWSWNQAGIITSNIKGKLEDVVETPTTTNMWINNAFTQAAPVVYGPRLLRTVCTGSKFSVYAYTGPAYTSHFMLDGRPTKVDPHIIGTAAAWQFIELTFPDARHRLVEWYTDALIQSVFTTRPGWLYKPDAFDQYRISVVGDSFVAAAPNPGLGIYQQMHRELGPNVRELFIDGIGGTGYIAQASGGPEMRYINRLAKVAAFNPHMHIVHGGGANDLNGGNSVATVVAAVVAYLQAARAAMPNTKLVYIEGFVTPLYFNTFGPSYRQIQAAVQAACTDLGIYYVGTNDPNWLRGTSYAGSAVDDQMPNRVMIQTDGVHLTPAGNRHLRRMLGQRLRRIIRDNGTLLNTRIAA